MFDISQSMMRLRTFWLFQEWEAGCNEDMLNSRFLDSICIILNISSCRYCRLSVTHRRFILFSLCYRRNRSISSTSFRFLPRYAVCYFCWWNTNLNARLIVHWLITFIHLIKVPILRYRLGIDSSTTKWSSGYGRLGFKNKLDNDRRLRLISQVRKCVRTCASRLIRTDS